MDKSARYAKKKKTRSFFFARILVQEFKMDEWGTDVYSVNQPRRDDIAPSRSASPTLRIIVQSSHNTIDENGPDGTAYTELGKF